MNNEIEILTQKNKQKYADEVQKYRQYPNAPVFKPLPKKELRNLRKKKIDYSNHPLYGYFDKEPTNNMNEEQEGKDFNNACLFTSACDVRVWLEKISLDESYTENQRKNFKYHEHNLLKYLLQAHPEKEMLPYTILKNRYELLDKELEENND